MSVSPLRATCFSIRWRVVFPPLLCPQRSLVAPVGPVSVTLTLCRYCRAVTNKHKLDYKRDL